MHLVDLRGRDLLEITEMGVRTTAGVYEFDSLVLATGFDAMTGALLGIDITGRDGVSLRENDRSVVEATDTAQRNGPTTCARSAR